MHIHCFEMNWIRNARRVLRKSRKLAKTSNTFNQIDDASTHSKKVTYHFCHSLIFVNILNDVKCVRQYNYQKLVTLTHLITNY